MMSNSNEVRFVVLGQAGVGKSGMCITINYLSCKYGIKGILTLLPKAGVSRRKVQCPIFFIFSKKMSFLKKNHNHFYLESPWEMHSNKYKHDYGIGLEIYELLRILRNKTNLYGWWLMKPMAACKVSPFLYPLHHGQRRSLSPVSMIAPRIKTLRNVLEGFLFVSLGILGDERKVWNFSIISKRRGTECN